MTEPAPAENQEKLLQQFADLPDESGRHEFLSRNPTLLRPEIVTALADQAREKIRVDVQQALRLADAAQNRRLVQAWCTTSDTSVEK